MAAPPRRSRELSEDNPAQQGANHRHREAPDEQAVEEAFDVTPERCPAMKSAPTVESDDRSTRLALTFMVHAMFNGSIMPSCFANSGAIGRNAGNTTPDVLL